MSRIRFATARSVFDSFPEMRKQCTVAPTDESPVNFLRNLSAQDSFDDAVTFCAHLLPRREAVWWAYETTTAFLNDNLQRSAACLLAAEAWVSAPDDDRRRAALEIGTQSHKDDPLTWLALAAGWSGGMLCTHPQSPLPVPPYLTARAARIAIQLSLAFVPLPERASRLRACISDGIKLAETGLS